LGKSPGQTYEALRGSGFSQPKGNPRGRGLVTQHPVMASTRASIIGQSFSRWVFFAWTRSSTERSSKVSAFLPLIVVRLAHSTSKSGRSPQTSHYVTRNPSASPPWHRKCTAWPRASKAGSNRGTAMRFASSSPNAANSREKFSSEASSRQVNIFAKLGRAVKHTGLAAHKQRLYLMFPDRRKDLSDRGRDQGCLPSQGIGRRASRFAESARGESAPATPAIPRASLEHHVLKITELLTNPT